MLLIQLIWITLPHAETHIFIHVLSTNHIKAPSCQPVFIFTVVQRSHDWQLLVFSQLAVRSSPASDSGRLWRRSRSGGEPGGYVTAQVVRQKQQQRQQQQHIPIFSPFTRYWCRNITLWKRGRARMPRRVYTTLHSSQQNQIEWKANSQRTSRGILTTLFQLSAHVPTTTMFWILI